jgi:peroxiredoxin
MILATAVLLAFASRVCASELKRSDEAAKPEFTLQDMDGKTVQLKTFKGRTVLVHFFATWCESCREELPALTRFLSRSAPSISVVAIAVADADQRVKQFFERTPVNFPVLLDRDRAVAKSWNVSTLPSTYVLDARMKPLLRVDADFQWDTVDMDPATGNLIMNKMGPANTTSDSSDMKQRNKDHGSR